tara:strand:- start:96 stop:404 length:309 start_codon:yes stop_codon:yes gene_type:complete
MIKIILFIFLIILNGCAAPGSALLGPIFTGAKTGSIYQASLSYGTGKIVNDMVSPEMSIVDRKKLNKSLSKIPFTENNPIIVSYYKVDNVKFIEVIEPEPLP